ncbi:hypothetical protein ACQKKX_01890 [Neorhizobium sp. NPDC001467]|uniref:hypothetical protein n=1 Tax=Neorhizobium sp. NPDC001467 TaxID=3390595 RepID=UPI003D08E79D
MTKAEIEDQSPEEPLDPAMENIRRKMIKLQLVSGGILLVCFMAVLAAIVYKITRPAPQATSAQPVAGSLAVPADQPVTAVANLPAGFVVQSVSHSGNQILFYGQLDGVSKALIFDVSVGRVIADITVGNR